MEFRHGGFHALDGPMPGLVNLPELEQMTQRGPD
jgi:hypothetical protein